MSVMHLINFLDVSRGGLQHFFDRNVLRLPSAKSPAAGLGTAVHDALQLGQNLTNQHDFNLEAIYQQFDQSLQLQALTHPDYKKTASPRQTHHPAPV